MEYVKLLESIISGTDLNAEQSGQLMDMIMEGELSSGKICAVLAALRCKGTTPEEISGFASSMREHACRVPGVDPAELLDTCGTGGDRLMTFNISTATAIVCAGAGVKVAKHGNRSVSSKSGSADVLEKLGVNIEQSAEKVGASINKTGIGFMFAPMMHPAMKYAMPARKELGIPTVFNILGPLTNPAKAGHQVLGVANAEFAADMASVLKELGSVHALVVSGKDGSDEVSITDPTLCYEVQNSEIKSFEITPQEFGFSYEDKAALTVEDAAQSATIIQNVLRGEKGIRRDICVLNAAVGIYAADKADDIASGIKAAQNAIDSGTAVDILEKWKQFTSE